MYEIKFDPNPFLIVHDFLQEIAGNWFEDNYPPYNIVKLDSNHYRIDMAVAGFSKEEIEIERKGDILTISGKKKENQSENEKYLHKGIALRPFKKSFTLNTYVDVKEAELKNGLLSVHLVKELPEHLKPKKIPIN